MKMKREANLNDHVVPACLPKSGASLEIGTKCYITGMSTGLFVCELNLL